MEMVKVAQSNPMLMDDGVLPSKPNPSTAGSPFRKYPAATPTKNSREAKSPPGTTTITKGNLSSPRAGGKNTNTHRGTQAINKTPQKVAKQSSEGSKVLGDMIKMAGMGNHDNQSHLDIPVDKSANAHEQVATKCAKRFDPISDSGNEKLSGVQQKNHNDGPQKQEKAEADSSPSKSSEKMEAPMVDETTTAVTPLPSKTEPVSSNLKNQEILCLLKDPLLSSIPTTSISQSLAIENHPSSLKNGLIGTDRFDNTPRRDMMDSLTYSDDGSVFGGTAISLENDASVANTPFKYLTDLGQSPAPFHGQPDLVAATTSMLCIADGLSRFHLDDDDDDDDSDVSFDLPDSTITELLQDYHPSSF
jgi:hypothetical protein